MLNSKCFIPISYPNQSYDVPILWHNTLDYDVPILWHHTKMIHFRENVLKVLALDQHIKFPVVSLFLIFYPKT